MFTIKPLFVILAAAPNGGIGYMNTIPWKLKGDLQRFKDITMGNIVIMGRTTYESLPNGLPGRKVIVISERLANGAVSLKENVYFAKSLSDAIYMAEDIEGTEVYIAGGAKVYEEALKLPCTVVLTTVFKQAKEGYDTYIRNFSMKGFKLIRGPETVYDTDEETGLELISHAYSIYSSKGTHDGNKEA